jgi:hypothetical protein
LGRTEDDGSDYRNYECEYKAGYGNMPIMVDEEDGDGILEKIVKRKNVDIGEIVKQKRRKGVRGLVRKVLKFV